MQEQNTTPELPETESSASNESQLRQLASALTFSDDSPETDETADTSAADEGAETREKPKSKPKNLTELAERLGVEVKDLYELEVPSAVEGEKFTLGKLKDMMAERENFTVRELAWEEEKVRKEQEFSRASAELQTLLSALPKSAIKPEILEAVRQKHETAVRGERAKTLEVIPEWRNEERRTTELTGIVEHLKGYGFPANYIQSIFDHRTIKYIRDNWLREQRTRKVLEQVKELKPKTVGKSKTATQKSTKPQSTQPKSREQRLREQYLSILNKA